MWMRMLSTDTSMRFFILGSILPFGPPRPCYLNALGPIKVSPRTSVKSECGEGETRAACPDRRPQPYLPGVLRAPTHEHVRRPGDQCRLRLHLDAGDRAGLPARVRDRRLRSCQTHVPFQGVRAVEGRAPRDAGGPPASDGDGARGARG